MHNMNKMLYSVHSRQYKKFQDTAIEYFLSRLFVNIFIPHFIEFYIY